MSERCFCDFCNSSFLIRGSVIVHWLPVSILKSGMKHLRRNKSYQFQPPKGSFCARTFKVQKYRTKRSGLLMFSEIGKLHAKKIIHFTPAGECVQSVQSLEERLEDLHSLSLNFCLTKFLRKIERAFFQVFSTPLLINFQTHVFGYPNTYFWIYKIFIWA